MCFTSRLFNKQKQQTSQSQVKSWNSQTKKDLHRKTYQHRSIFGLMSPKFSGDSPSFWFFLTMVFSLFFGRLSIFSSVLVTCVKFVCGCFGRFVCLVDVIWLRSADLLDDISFISSLIFFTQSGRQYVNDFFMFGLAS